MLLPIITIREVDCILLQADRARLHHICDTLMGHCCFHGHWMKIIGWIIPSYGLLNLTWCMVLLEQQTAYIKETNFLFLSNNQKLQTLIQVLMLMASRSHWMHWLSGTWSWNSIALELLYGIVHLSGGVLINWRCIVFISFLLDDGAVLRNALYRDADIMLRPDLKSSCC